MFWYQSIDFNSKVLILICILAAAFSSCAPAKFSSVDEVLKAKLIAEQSVLDNGSGQTGSSSGAGSDSSSGSGSGSSGSRSPASAGALPGDSGEPSPSGSGTTPAGSSPLVPASGSPLPADYTEPYTPGSPIPPSPTQVPLYFVCSNGITTEMGTNLLAAASIKLNIVQYHGVPGVLYEDSRCTEDDPTLVAQFKAGKKVTFKKCAPKGYLIRRDLLTLVSPNAPGLNTAVQNDYFTLDVVANGNTSLLSGKGGLGENYVKILFDVNAQETLPAGYQTTAANQALCDLTASPLFVDMRSEYEKSQKFSLTAPWDGVLFDILGKNAEPAAHSPYRISWFESASMAYITLPNKRGQVLGIDQLFGDNTLGPDGKFADNGYTALAKYDINGDEVISSEDAVYAKLKVWQDRNHDGKAASSELMSLVDAQIDLIDLRYDSKFSEADKYGNTIKYKSVAKMQSGDYRLVFDVWFELNQFKARQAYTNLTSAKANETGGAHNLPTP